MKMGVVRKLHLSMLAMVVLILVPIGFGLDRGITALYYNQNSQELLATGQRFADFLARAPDPGAREAVRAIAEIAGTPLLVLDGEGVVTSSSVELDNEIGQPFLTDETRRALAGEPSVVLATDSTLPGSLFVASLPVTGDGRVLGAVVLFRPADDVQSALLQVRRFLWIGGAGMILLISGFAWLLSKRLAQPLLLMRDATERMARGEYRTRVDAPSRDELGELASAINRLGAWLQRLEEGRRSFFANVSHELRTPLSYLRGYSDALAQGLATSQEEVREYGRILSEESRRLSRLVDDLFELARAEEGRLSLTPEPVDLNDVIRRVGQRMQGAASRKGIRLELAPAEGEARVVADADRLDQVLVNFLDNALRHTPDGGRIYVSVIRTDGEDEGEEKSLGVAVEDSGPGFQSSDQDVWARFVRGDGSRNRNFGGAGLGLSIAKSLVEAQGGRVFSGVSKRLGGARVGFLLTDPERSPR